MYLGKLYSKQLLLRLAMTVVVSKWSHGRVVVGRAGGLLSAKQGLAAARDRTSTLGRLLRLALIIDQDSVR